LEDVLQAHEEVETLRLQVDAAATAPAVARPYWLPAAWAWGITELIERTQRLRWAVGLQAKGQAVTLEDIQLLRHFAWTAAEQASHERGLVGAALSSGGNMDPAALEQLALHRGEVELAWAAVLNLAGMPEMPAAI